MCLFKHFTGIPCPGCGLTRAFLHFFEGNLSEAFYFHPLFWLVPIIFVVILFRKQAMISKIYQSQLFWCGLLLIFIGVYAYRMLEFFPNQLPMDFNPEAILPRIFG